MTPAPLSLSRPQARRIALAAQGFRDPQHATPTLRTLDRAVRRTGVLQVDSVNVLQRAHYMPLFSRMGAYDTHLLHRAASGRRQRRLVEYWAHVQALMPVELWPAMRHRMASYEGGAWWGRVPEPVMRRLIDQVRDRGASTARELQGEEQRRTDHWGWNWSEARQGLDLLYRTGRLAISERNAQFEIRYDLPERVLPDHVLGLPTPSAHGAILTLVRRAAASHGIATAHCLRDYYRIRTLAQTMPAIEHLVASGELIPASVEGWDRPAYLHRDAARPRRIAARTLLSPFDPVVWERERTERLFCFHYRIEIYTPAARRKHGYYVLPFLLGDRIVARVDLKADRRRRTLLVPAAYAEPGAPPQTGAELAEHLRELADWLGLEEVVVGTRGDLASSLAPSLVR